MVNAYGIDFYLTLYEFDRMIVGVKNKYLALVKIFGEDTICLADHRVLFWSLLNFFLFHFELANISIETSNLS